MGPQRCLPRGGEAAELPTGCLCRRCGPRLALARPLAVYKPATAIRAHGLDQGHERPALLGERVLHPRGYLRVRPALDNALVLERPQAQRERAGTDPLQRSLQLAEATASVSQVADYEEGPLAGDDLRATTNWAGILRHCVWRSGVVRSCAPWTAKASIAQCFTN